MQIYRLFLTVYATTRESLYKKLSFCKKLAVHIRSIDRKIIFIGVLVCILTTGIMIVYVWKNNLTSKSDVGASPRSVPQPSVSSLMSRREPLRDIYKTSTQSGSARVLIRTSNPNIALLDLDMFGDSNACFDLAFWGDSVVAMDTGTLFIASLTDGKMHKIKAESYLPAGSICYFSSYTLTLSGGKLFVGSNPYKSQPGLFYLENPNQATPSSIPGGFSIVEQIGNQLLIKCIMSSEKMPKGQGYCLLDPVSLKSTPIAESNNKLYISSDSMGRLLFAGFDSDSMTLRYIIAVPGEKLDTHEGVVAEQNMPKWYTYTFGFYRNTNSILLAGDGIARVDSQSGKLEKIAYPDGYHPSIGLHSPEDDPHPGVTLTGPVLCVNFGEYTNGTNTHRYAYRVDSGIFVDHDQNCPQKSYDTIEKVRKKLPPGYDIRTMVIPKTSIQRNRIPENDPLPEGWEEGDGE